MSKMSLKKKVPYGLFMPPEMLIWLSLLFNQKPLGPNDLSQKKKLRSILENSIFSEKPLNSSHLLSKSFNLKILVEIPRLIKMIQQEEDSVTMDKGCRSYWERKNQSQTFTTFFFLLSGNAAWGPGWRSMVFVTWQIKKQGNSCAKASGTWKIIDCNSLS